MKHLTLTRFAYLPECTLGRLTADNGLELYTIERPWRDNQPFVSCIPDGSYDLEWDVTGRIRDVPRLRGTEPRSQINIHAANFASELHGCVAPGMDYELTGKTGKVSQSRAALGLLMEFILSDVAPTAEGESLETRLLIRSMVA